MKDKKKKKQDEKKQKKLEQDEKKLKKKQQKGKKKKEEKKQAAETFGSFAELYVPEPSAHEQQEEPSESAYAQTVGEPPEPADAQTVEERSESVHARTAEEPPEPAVTRTEKELSRSAAAKAGGGQSKSNPVKREKKSAGQSSSEASYKRAERAAAKDSAEPQASYIFRALGDEVRLKIVSLLDGHELCGAELLGSLSIVQSTLSHHMKILCESGVVQARKQGKWTYYSVDQDTVRKAIEFLGKYQR